MKVWVNERTCTINWERTGNWVTWELTNERTQLNELNSNDGINQSTNVERNQPNAQRTWATWVWVWERGTWELGNVGINP